MDQKASMSDELEKGLLNSCDNSDNAWVIFIIIFKLNFINLNVTFIVI